MLSDTEQAVGVSLRNLWPRAQFFGASDVRTTSCCGDSRVARPGYLFVAIDGTRLDGHEFAEHAVARGATAVLAERALPLVGVPVCVVPDTRKSYGELCQALAGQPSHKLKVIGVTGTNGKTTTSTLIASILRAAGHRTGILGTLGYDDSAEQQTASLTTPSPPALASWLARMEANGCSHAVVEVSSHALAQNRIAGIDLTAACITNVRRDHLDYHGSLANYRRAKERIFEYLVPDGIAVFNADDRVNAELAGKLDFPALTIGLRSEADLTGTLLERYRSEQTFVLTAGGTSALVRTPMIGDAHIYNCLMAAAMGLALGIDLQTVVRGIEQVRHVAGRLERIECGQPFGVFVDYAHTPDALTASLTTLRDVTPGRVICVFGAGGNRDTQKRPLMGRAVELGADLAIITSDNPRDEHPATIAEQILSGFSEPAAAELVQDRAAAIGRALSLAEDGDTARIAGRGHETHQVIGRHSYEFDDRDVARSWLYNIEPADTSDWAGGSRMPVGNI